jgi:hypothetical protein
LMGRGKAGGGQHGSADSERESEDGVLPLNHFQGDAEVVEYGHGKIVEQGTVVSGQWSMLALGFRLGFCEKLTRTSRIPQEGVELCRAAPRTQST